MATSQDLTNTRWRKSSYSGNTGGDCIECAPLNGTTWRKSSYSGSGGGECIEFAAPRQGTIAVRDSKNPEGPAFTTTPRAFATFVQAAATGTLR
ncbi:DUF397 domain-containing protein [Streptomyces durmitorensis]|uniref:DUF397 domain-containing protein n=1 Tax=Streptomyces durmitorensis TaxID=319947 RepID=A0ABY4PW18_9ACTN|nr:DUF397 domain-containing protein [Streptomyces durmitorensis]UQT57379.1 DUF397 domain-containing protein [Streptomyces durmitorensis]